MCPASRQWAESLLRLLLLPFYLPGTWADGSHPPHLKPPKSLPSWGWLLTCPVSLPPQIPAMLLLHVSRRCLHHRSPPCLPRTQRQASPTADLVISKDFSPPLESIQRTIFTQPQLNSRSSPKKGIRACSGTQRGDDSSTVTSYTSKPFSYTTMTNPSTWVILTECLLPWSRYYTIC